MLQDVKKSSTPSQLRVAAMDLINECFIAQLGTINPNTSLYANA
jgi:hypothetical protein